VQPLSVVLARKPWIRDLSLPRPARSGCAVMEVCPKGADYGGKYSTTMGSSPPQASIPAPFLGSIFNRLLAATRQVLGQGGLEVFSARIAGTADKRPSLLLGPIARADTRCRVREMTEGFLDQRGFRIIATTVEQAPQSHHPDLRPEFRLPGSKIPCGAHEGRGLGGVVPRAYGGPRAPSIGETAGSADMGLSVPPGVR
jgi:hypothetical protein